MSYTATPLHNNIVKINTILYNITTLFIKKTTTIVHTFTIRVLWWMIYSSPTNLDNYLQRGEKVQEIPPGVKSIFLW